MKKIKVKMIGKGTDKEPYTVALPAWKMTDDKVDYINMECYILVPDNETKIVGNKIKLDQQKIRKKYKKNWSKFNASSVEL